MATNVYFNNFSPNSISEQRLFEDLITESIQIHGHDIKYLPREVYDSADDVLGENPNAKFSRAYNMEMYLANVEGYEGDGDFFSKFGLEVRDTSNFVVSRRTFQKYVPSTIAQRPREGDLIYVPVLQKIFEIKFVEEELLFFSLGNRNPYIYELRCEVFRYSNEDLDTGDEEIDDIEHSIAAAQRAYLGVGSGDYFTSEIVYQGASLETATFKAEMKHWDRDVKYIEMINNWGIITDGQQIIGTKSGSSYNVISHDDMGDFVDYDDSDNRILQTEADEFIDFTEVNPFGVP